MQKEVRFATIEDFDLIYDALREDLEEQGVLHRFKYSKLEFKDLIFGKKPRATFLILWNSKNDEKGFSFFFFSKTIN